MEAEDWEILHHNSDSDSVPDSQQISYFNTNCMIHNNYFSLHSPNNPIATDDPELSSKNSDYPVNLSAESWSDSGTDDKRVIEFESNLDVGFVYNHQNERFQEGFDGVEDLSTENGEDSGEVLSDSGVSSCEMMGDELGMEKDAILGDVCSERGVCGEEGGNEERRVEEKRKISGVVWWKLPIELLRYCVFKGPVWTVSIAAAFMGFVILGRRLYKMKKKKSRDLGLRITMDDKKISQFMTRAARLNEAFSVVKRVPIIRPSLPAVGVTPWPLASLR